MIRLMIVEDNEIVRGGLIKYFNQEKDIEVVADAFDAATALQFLKGNPEIDIVMADWNMPDMDGLELTMHLAKEFPAVKTMILTMHSKPEYKDKAKVAGAKGYVLKDSEFDEVVDAIRRIACGEEVF